MFPELLRHQMFYGDLLLLFNGVPCQLNDFHTIAQSRMNGVKRVGCCYEQYFRKIVFDFQVIVTECIVLLRIQNL